MEISTESLLEEFINEKKKEYPHLTKGTLKKICLSPFLFTKSIISNGECTSVRLKYFGVFQVHRKRGVHMLESLEKRRKQNKVDDVEYDRLKIVLKKFKENEREY